MITSQTPTHQQDPIIIAPMKDMDALTIPQAQTPKEDPIISPKNDIDSYIFKNQFNSLVEDNENNRNDIGELKQYVMIQNRIMSEFGNKLSDVMKKNDEFQSVIAEQNKLIEAYKEDEEKTSKAMSDL